MGILDKMKNLFTEEVDEPIEKKEPKKVEVKKEVKKEAKKEINKEIKREKPIVEQKREIQKQERKIEIAPARKETAMLYEKEIEEEPVVKREKTLPLYFSDEDFNDLPPKKEKPVVREFYREKKKEEKVEEKKYFKPSPIISPVYGILDKNYKKDDITTKEADRSYDPANLTVDDIRNKAYGTLEDDLERNLIKETVIEEKESAIDIFDELKETELKKDIKEEVHEVESKEVEEIKNEKLEEEAEELTRQIALQRKQIEEINEKLKTNIQPEKEHITSRKIDNILEELDEIEELIPDKTKETELDVNTKEENEDNNDKVKESDLLNLIDSMYEARDE